LPFPKKLTVKRRACRKIFSRFSGHNEKKSLPAPAKKTLTLRSPGKASSRLSHLKQRIVGNEKDGVDESMGKEKEKVIVEKYT